MTNEINTNIPQSARVYDYWLGGKDNFPADRALGDAIAEQVPTIRTMVRGQRAFLGRAVRWLAGEAGIRQFLDIGTGIPSAGNVHEVAQEIAPEARVLYVDNARSCWPTPGPWSPAPTPGRSSSSRPTCASPRRSWPTRPWPRPWT